jgi:hypothetical protein
MKEILHFTTTGRYGSHAGHPIPASDPAPPAMEEGWSITMIGSAAAEGILFWFWQCEKIEPMFPTEIVHAVERLEGRDFASALCGAGDAHLLPGSDKWSTDSEKVTCPRCLEKQTAEAR